MNNKIVFVLLALIAWCFSANAQSPIEAYGFAGEDKDEFFLSSSEQPTKEITIGKSCPQVDGVSYYWEAISYPDNPNVYPLFAAAQNTSQTKVNIWDPGIYTYQVCRVSHYGYQYERVSIRVLNHITITGANPKHGCWKEGEEIRIDDFEIQTDPPGCIKYVKLAKDSEVADNGFQILFDEVNMPIHFMVYDQGLDHDPVLSDFNECYIKVVDELSSPSAELPNFLKLKDVVDGFKTLDSIMKTASDMRGRLNKLPKGIIQPYADGVVTVAFSYHEDCCYHNPSAYAQITITGGCVAGINLYGAIIPGVYIHGGLEAGFKPNFSLNFSFDCYDAEIHIPGYIEASAGLTAGVPGTLDIGGDIVIGGTLELYWKYSDGFQCPVDFYFKIRAHITTPFSSFTWEWDPLETGGE